MRMNYSADYALMEKISQWANCLCKGTQAYIHVNCLNAWRFNAVGSRQFYECPTCKYHYRTSRIWYAELLVNPILIAALTLITILSAITILAYFIKFFAFLVIGVRLGRNAFALSGKLVFWAILLIGGITMVVTLFGDQNNNPNINAGPVIHIVNDIMTVEGSSSLFTFCGYGFSLMGFAMFIKNVYSYVEKYMRNKMQQLGEHILEVN
jgi:hypothetical protein